MSLPVIDLAAFESGAASERERLRAAACGAGAFLLRGHGVPEALTATLLEGSRRFFTLPQAERDAIDMIHSPHFRGYSAVGTERTQGRPDLREQLDVGPEEIPPVRAAGDPPWFGLMGPNLWPASLPGLRGAVLDWMRPLRDVSTRSMAAIVEAIGFPRDTFGDAFTGQPHEKLKIIKYPGVAAASPQGVGEHSDSGLLTLIVQDDTRGLQVELGDRYVDVMPHPGEMIAVLGRALRAASNERTVAARHRVMAPPSGSERISVAYFLNPRLDYDDYGIEALAVALRSHPATARRYFGDLVTA